VILIFSHQKTVVIEMPADIVKSERHREPAVLIVNPAIEHFLRCSGDIRPDSAGLTFPQGGIPASGTSGEFNND